MAFRRSFLFIRQEQGVSMDVLNSMESGEKYRMKVDGLGYDHLLGGLGCE